MKRSLHWFQRQTRLSSWLEVDCCEVEVAEVDGAGVLLAFDAAELTDCALESWV